MANDRHAAATEQGAMTQRDSDPPNSLATLASSPGIDECDLCCEAIPGYVCGDLKTIDASWLEEHTAMCGYCRRELTGFQRLDHLLSEYESSSCASVAAPAFRKRDRELARYGSMESPLGTLLIAVSDEGVCEIDFGRNHGIDVFRDRMTERGFDLIEDQRAIQPVVDQLSEYFQGRRNTFDVPVDFSHLSPFARDVLQATASVPPGGVATNSEIATRIGNPGASRAVGNALGRNPIPIILPCHRVVPADRSIGKYTGGVDIKVKLLSLEGAALPTGALVS
jgi:methylated-DNA-[protein]-cysteine S-methyltransferase